MKNLGALQCKFSVRSAHFLPDCRSLFSVTDVTDLILFWTPGKITHIAQSPSAVVEFWKYAKNIFVVLPPSVVMSQKTFRCFPSLAGSIQYFPSPLDAPMSWMSLQDFDAKVKIAC